MKVWLTGSSGMLGCAVGRDLDRAGHEAICTDVELDISNLSIVLAQARNERPDVIINCAAFTNVNDCETENELAFRVNAAGPMHIGRAAAEVGAVVLHVSTDYVFGGDAGVPYREADPTGPKTAYGRSKAEGERLLLCAMEEGGRLDKAYIVRTSWLFGTDGGNFVATMLRMMAERHEISVVADQRGCPTFCDDLSQAILGLLGLRVDMPRRAPAGVYHFANAGDTTWHEFAGAILDLARGCGFDLKCRRVRPIATSEFPTPAERPAFSVLCTEKVTRTLGASPRSWRIALDAHLRAVLDSMQGS